MQTVADPQRKQKFIVLIIIGILYSGSIAYFFQSLPSAKLTSDFFPRWHASRMLLTADRSIYDWTNADEVSAVHGLAKASSIGLLLSSLSVDFYRAVIYITL